MKSKLSHECNNENKSLATNARMKKRNVFFFVLLVHCIEGTLNIVTNSVSMANLLLGKY